jgi:5-oxoprolinase (ATP-hydrolysing)
VLRLLDAEGLAAAEASPRLSQRMRPRSSQARCGRAGIRISVQAHLRYLGTDSALPVPLGTLAELKSAFEAMHLQRFGFISPDKLIEIEAIEVEALGRRRPSARNLTCRYRSTRFPNRRRRRGSTPPAPGMPAPVFLRAGLEPKPLHRRPCPHHRAASDRRGRA